MDVKAFFREIDAIRRARGISVETMCRASGIRQSTYYTWLNGKYSPTISTLLQVLNVLRAEITVTEVKNGSA